MTALLMLMRLMKALLFVLIKSQEKKRKRCLEGNSKAERKMKKKNEVTCRSDGTRDEVADSVTVIITLMRSSEVNQLIAGF